MKDKINVQEMLNELGIGELFETDSIKSFAKLFAEKIINRCSEQAKTTQQVLSGQRKSYDFIVVDKTSIQKVKDQIEY